MPKPGYMTFTRSSSDERAWIVTKNNHRIGEVQTSPEGAMFVRLENQLLPGSTLEMFIYGMNLAKDKYHAGEKSYTYTYADTQAKQETLPT